VSLAADALVIGLWAFGSAVVYQLARRGATVIGIHRFSPPHDFGSSHRATLLARTYTVSPDLGFSVDAHPSQPHVTVISACSGHGFKHSDGLGEAVTQQALVQVGGFNLGALSLRRLADAAPR
jgi:glycine/D-amino acid oxidase-like deaminating enzyme